jgi:hypothetical protein
MRRRKPFKLICGQGFPRSLGNLPTFDELLYRPECLYRNGSLSVSGFREAAR